MNMKVVAGKTLPIPSLRFRQHIHGAPTDRLMHIAHKTGMHFFCSSKLLSDCNSLSATVWFRK